MIFQFYYSQLTHSQQIKEANFTHNATKTCIFVEKNWWYSLWIDQIKCSLSFIYMNKQLNEIGILTA